MRKKFLIIIIAFCSFFCLIAEEKITLAIGDWEPYASSIPGNANVAEVIALEAFKLVGFDVEFEYFPWIRSYNRVKKVEADATFPWVKTKEIESDFIVSKEVILSVKTVFFHVKDLDFNWTSLSDLKRYKIGGVIGYEFTAILENEGIPVEKVGKESLNFRKLAKGRIDVIPGALIATYYQMERVLEKDEFAFITHHPKAIQEDDTFMLFSKDHPRAQELADKFDEGLIKLKQSGRYKQILSQLKTN